MKQIYKFIKKKEKNQKNSAKKDDTDIQNEYLISTLLMSPKHEIHSKLRDSLAAKAANKALLKWHSKMPLASLHDLENIYNKFYEYYYDHLESSRMEKAVADEDDLLYHNYDPFSLGHTHNIHHTPIHHSHRNNHFNLLDFIKDKINNKNEDEDESDLFDFDDNKYSKKKNSRKSSSKNLFKKLIGIELYIKFFPLIKLKILIKKL